MPAADMRERAGASSSSRSSAAPTPRASGSTHSAPASRRRLALSGPVCRWGPVRAGVLYTNDAYGRGLAEAFQHHFRGEVISADPVGTGSDMEPFVAYLKASQIG